MTDSISENPFFASIYLEYAVSLVCEKCPPSIASVSHLGFRWTKEEIIDNCCIVDLFLLFYTVHVARGIDDI